MTPSHVRRANLALLILQEGGHFLYRLEHNPKTGSKHRQWRLMTAQGQMLRGTWARAMADLQTVHEFTVSADGFRRAIVSTLVEGEVA